MRVLPRGNWLNETGEAVVPGVPGVTSRCWPRAASSRDAARPGAVAGFAA